MIESKENKPKGRPKKSDSSEPYKGTPFQDRLNKVFGDSKESQDVAAKAFGVSRQSFGNWLQGRNQPDFDTLVKIAKHYGVSADYLLGLSEARATSEDMKTACKVSGLPESTIECLRSIADSVNGLSKKDLVYILESKQFRDIVSVFFQTRQQSRFLYSDKYSSSEETINTYLDELDIEKTGRVGRLMLDFIINGGIEPMYKHVISEDMTKLFDEYKERILSHTLFYPVCLYPNSSGYTAIVPDLPGCVSEGESLREALEMATDAAKGWVKDEFEGGGAAPEPTPLDEVKAEEYEDGIKRLIAVYCG